MVHVCDRCKRCDDDRAMHFLHIATHIPNSDYRCNICQRNYKHLRSYKRHYNKNHPDIIVNEVPPMPIVSPSVELNEQLFEREEPVIEPMIDDPDIVMVDDIDDSDLTLNTRNDNCTEAVVKKLIDLIMNNWLEMLSIQSIPISAANMSIKTLISGLLETNVIMRSTIGENYRETKIIIEHVSRVVGTAYRRLKLLREIYFVPPVLSKVYSRMLTVDGFRNNEATMFSIRTILEKVLSNGHIANNLVFAEDFVTQSFYSHPLSGSRAQYLRTVSSFDYITQVKLFL